MKTREAVPLVEVLGNRVIQQKPWTCVVLHWAKKGENKKTYESSGFARCNWRDWFDKDLGVTIARNRAIFNAAAEIAASV